MPIIYRLWTEYVLVKKNQLIPYELLSYELRMKQFLCLSVKDVGQYNTDKYNLEVTKATGSNI